MVVVFLRPPQIDSGSGAWSAAAVGFDDRAVEVDVGVAGRFGGQQR
jgi:hypothetical protein